MRNKKTIAIAAACILMVTAPVLTAGALKIGKPDKVAKIKKLEKIDQQIGGIKKHLSDGEINQITTVQEGNEWRKNQAALTRFLLDEFKKGL